MHLNKLLALWEANSLISNEQNKNILEFMKERKKEQFFRFVKWLFIIGALWLVFGVINLIINLLELSFMEKVLDAIVKAFQFIFTPIAEILKNWFGRHVPLFLWGIACFVLGGLFLWISQRKKQNASVDALNISEEQKNILKSNWVFEIFTCLSFSIGFVLFNKLLIPDNVSYYHYAYKSFPVWHILGATAFIALAYKFSKVIYLLFGIYFVSLSVGMFSGYDYACYWIGASRPVVQILFSVILILIGYITELKANDNETKERFASVYSWTGLLMGFIALWITSLWGFDFDKDFSISTATELWIANILFIVASIASMYFGMKLENKLFFNYGLTFLIIETYTVFCSRLWDLMNVGVASLVMGILLIGTAKLLIKIYVKDKKKEEA